MASSAPAALATTPFWGGRVVLAAPLAPSSLGHPAAARSVLEECLMRYHSELGGFLLAFSNARFSVRGRYGSAEGALPLGRIVAEQPVVHAHIEAEVLLFRPVRGQVLEGVVTRVTQHHVNCLVAGMFNASILREHMAGGYAFADSGAGAWRSTPVRDRACELAAGEDEAGGGGGGGGARGKRAKGGEAAGRNALLAANPDCIEVGSNVCFRVSVLLHANGILNINGSLE
jgi:hypothetical protein